MSLERGDVSTYETGADLIVEWRNKHFSTLDRSDGAGYCSPDFSFGGERWLLVIHPNGSSWSGSSGHVDLQLVKYSSGPSTRVSLSLSLKTAKGERHNEQHVTKDFDDDDYFQDFNRFIPRSELTRLRSDLLPDDVLTVVCTMKGAMSAGSDTVNDPEHAFVEPSTQLKEISTQTVEECIESVEASTQTIEEKGEACASGFSTSSEEKKVLRDLKELFLNKEDCDVAIKVGGSEFPAHRAILKARSPVFASTFRHDMKENVTGIVEIDDCDPSSFSDFLSFLYCGDIGIISLENVFGLFTAADKYQVLDLRAKCLEFIRNNMAVDTFCETITLALQHSESELIAPATDFFVANAEEILLTVKWQRFAAENPTQSNELFIKFVRSVKHHLTVCPEISRG